MDDQQQKIAKFRDRFTDAAIDIVELREKLDADINRAIQFQLDTNMEHDSAHRVTWAMDEIDVALKTYRHRLRVAVKKRVIARMTLADLGDSAPR